MKSFRTLFCLSYFFHGNSFVPAFVKAGKVSFDPLFDNLETFKIIFLGKVWKKKILYDPTLPIGRMTV